MGPVAASVCYTYCTCTFNSVKLLNYGFFSTSLQRHYEASLYGPKHFRLYETIYEVNFLACWITTVLVYINLFSVSSNQQVVHVWCFEADSLQFKIISLPDWVQNYALKSGGTNMVTSTLEQKERMTEFYNRQANEGMYGLTVVCETKRNENL